MPPAASKSASLVFVFGDDEFSIQQRAREIFQKWTGESANVEAERIDASAANGGEALKAIARLRESLQTFPFFGDGKVIWFRDCNFLGDDRTAGSQAVTDDLGALAQELKAFSWDKVRLLISAGKVDKRKTFYKTLEKIGSVEPFAGWSMEVKDWASQAEMSARRQLRELGIEIADRALAELVANVGPNARLLHNEVEKLSLFVGNRTQIESDDISRIVTRNKQARAFALGDALGDRDLPRLLRSLDNELWEMKFDRQKSEIGLLYGLISKIRGLIFLKEMLQAGWLKMETDYNRFKLQLERVPADALPDDKRFNPLLMNPYVLFKAMSQVKNYSREELVAAMSLLLECNQRLIFSNLDEALVLQQTLSKIAARPPERATR